jgi:hypothetical protein
MDVYSQPIYDVYFDYDYIDNLLMVVMILMVSTLIF